MNRIMSCAATVALVLASGCGAEQKPAPGTTTTALAESWHLAQAPTNALGIKEARAADDGADVTCVGRVSGFNATRASFQLADLSMTPCNERPDDTCETPWDYCCETPDTLKASTLTVELRAGPRPLEASLDGFHGFTYLEHVTVKGKVEKDTAGNVIVVAEALHVGK